MTSVVIRLKVKYFTFSHPSYPETQVPLILESET